MRVRTSGIVGLLAAAAACAPLAGAEGDEARRVLEVRVRGNRRLSQAAVLAQVRTQAGRLYDAKVITQDRRRLLRTGRFNSVVIYSRPSPGGMIVTIELDERELVAKIAFRGNREFKDEKLLKDLTFSAGSPLDISAVKAGARTLELKYRNDGHYFAEVSFDAKALTERREVIYSVVEGPDVRIRSIDLEGITFYDACERTWMEIFSLRAASRSRWSILPGGKLKDDDLQYDVNLIRKRYVDQGFLDVEVGRKLEFSADKTDVHLTYTVRENARFYVDKVIFRDNRVFSDAELARRTGLQRGDVVKAEALAIDAERLRQVYGQFGYVDASVRPSKQFAAPGAALPDWARTLDDDYPVALVDIVFTIHEGPQSRVGRIDVRPSSAYTYGDTVTQRRVVLRKMTLFPGQLFSTAAATESENRIMETRIFSKATVKPIDPIDPIAREFNVRDAVVEISEGRTANVILGVGVSTNTGVMGTLAFMQRNFDAGAWPKSWRDMVYGHAWKGAAQSVQISASPGTEFSRFNLNWTEPAINDRPYSLNLRAFAGSGIRETYDEYRTGLGASVGHRFKNGWFVELSSRTENVEITGIEHDAPAQIVKLDGATFIQGIRAALIRDRTDSRWKPSTGDVLKVSFEHVLGDFTFEKVLAEYRLYQTLHVDAFDRKHILSGKVWAGQIISYAPTFERYYAGGAGSIRGFRYRGISPRSVKGDEPIGGDFIAYAGAEYSYPLVAETLRGVVFLDSGTVHQDVAFDTWRVSTGFGFRLAVPGFGSVPVSLDFGFPIVKDRQDDSQLVSFTLGWVF